MHCFQCGIEGGKKTICLFFFSAQICVRSEKKKKKLKGSSIPPLSLLIIFFILMDLLIFLLGMTLLRIILLLRLMYTTHSLIPEFTSLHCYISQTTSALLFSSLMPIHISRTTTTVHHAGQSLHRGCEGVA